MLSFDDVLIRPQSGTVNSRKEVELHREFEFENGDSKVCVPIIAANTDTTGTPAVANVFSKYRLLTALSKYTRLSEWQNLLDESGKHTIYTIGLRDDRETIVDKESSVGQLNSLMGVYGLSPDFLMLDVANGYTQEVVERTKELKSSFPTLPLIVGSVGTLEGAERLLDAGADIIKVGIGNGSPCSTRDVTGVGVPQVTAIDEIATAIDFRDYDKRYVLSEGGCRNTGDIMKAFAAGADFVMNGSMFAGHDETSRHYYGMASREARRRHHGLDYAVAFEGEEKLVPERGSLHRTVEQVLGAIQSACTYVGARNLEEFKDKANLWEV